MMRTKSGILLLVCAILFACGPGNEEKLRNAVFYAKSALQQAGANPFSRATFQGVLAREGNAVDYIKAVTPKNDPMLKYFEFNTKPTKPWTVIVRPGTDPGEYFIEGYGNDLKKPLVYDSVTVNIPQM
jgi:hypothetical protein